jgi:hypothetical protein
MVVSFSFFLDALARRLNIIKSNNWSVRCVAAKKKKDLAFPVTNNMMKIPSIGTVAQLSLGLVVVVVVII